MTAQATIDRVTYDDSTKASASIEWRDGEEQHTTHVDDMASLDAVADVADHPLRPLARAWRWTTLEDVGDLQMIPYCNED